MSFASPFALAWATLTIPLVIFYILKIRMRRVPVSTTIFWQQIFDEKSPRSLWQQLRHWLSLAVQLLWLLLLVLALAEPFFRSESLQMRRIVLVIDNSASMRATDVSPTRLDAAKQAARRQVAALRFRDEIAIVSAGTQPQVHSGLTGHERTLQRAIDDVTSTDGPTRVADAIQLAKRLLGDRPNGQVVLYSDGGFVEASEYRNDPIVKLFPIGTPAANVGISRFQVRRSLLDPIGYEILIEVVNHSDDPVKCRLDIDLGENPVDVIPLNLVAGQRWSQTIEKTSIDGGQLTARLKHSDALAADNQAVAILPKRQMQRVVLVSPGSLFLRKALEANPLVELSVQQQPPDQYEAGVVYVFHREVPDKVPAGASLVIDPLRSSDLWEAAGPLENPIVTKQDAESPLMRHVRLDNVVLPQARQLKPTGGHRVLVGAVSGDPLFFSFEQSGKKVAVLTVNLDEGDLTFRTAFPILVSNTLTWFAGEAGELRESLVAGAVTEISLPPPASAKSKQEYQLRSPSGKILPLPSGVERASIGPLHETGVWKVELRPSETAQTASKQESATVLSEIACNLANAAESDLRVPEAWEISPRAGIAASAWFVRPLWFYLLSGALVAAVGEWYLYQRRWIG
jgi:hypothetical protein